MPLGRLGVNSWIAAPVLARGILLLLLLTLGSNSASAAESWPPGVHISAGSTALYPASNDAGCCWVGPDAVIHAIEPPNADALILTIAIPPYAGVNGGTTISVRVGGSAVESKCCIGIGVNEVAFPLPKHTEKTRDVPIMIHSSSDFVPARLELNGDRRVLSVLLRGIAFQDTITGERYVNGVAINAVGGATKMLDILVAVLGALVTLIFGLKKWRTLWVAILITAPFTFALGVAGTTLMLPKAVLISAVACLAFRLPRLERPSAQFKWIALALMLFVIDMFVSDVKAHYLTSAIRETLKQMEYAVTFGVAYVAYRSDPDEGVLRVTIAALAIVVSILAFAQGLFGASEFAFIFGHDVPRVAGPLEGPNQLGAFLGIVLAIIASFIDLRHPRILEAVALVLGTAALVLTLSRGGLLALAITLVIVAALRWKLWFANTVLVALGLTWTAAFVFTLQAAFTAHPFASRLLGSANAYNGGLGTRSQLWQAASTLWRSSPWLGIGPGNYELEVGTLFAGVKTHANNYYLQILAEQGVVGLVSYLAVVACSIRALARAPWKPLAVAALAAISALAFHQLVDGLLIYPKIGVFFWAVVGITIADHAADPRILPACTAPVSE